MSTVGDPKGVHKNKIKKKNRKKENLNIGYPIKRETLTLTSSYVYKTQVQNLEFTVRRMCQNIAGLS